MYSIHTTNTCHNTYHNTCQYIVSVLACIAFQYMPICAYSNHWCISLVSDSETLFFIDCSIMAWWFKSIYIIQLGILMLLPVPPSGNCPFFTSAAWAAVNNLAILLTAPTLIHPPICPCKPCAPHMPPTNMAWSLFCDLTVTWTPHACRVWQKLPWSLLPSSMAQVAPACSNLHSFCHFRNCLPVWCVP